MCSPKLVAQKGLRSLGVETSAQERWASSKGHSPKGIRQRAFATLLAHQETLRRTSTSAPTPEDISTTLAARVTNPTSGGPPLLGSAVALAVAVAVALAVGVEVDIAVELAVLPPPPPPPP